MNGCGASTQNRWPYGHADGFFLQYAAAASTPPVASRPTRRSTTRNTTTCLRRCLRLQVGGHRAGAQDRGDLARAAERHVVLDLHAAAPVDPVRRLLVVDERQRDEPVVEHDGEVLGTVERRLAGRRVARAAL